MSTYNNIRSKSVDMISIIHAIHPNDQIADFTHTVVRIHRRLYRVSVGIYFSVWASGALPAVIDALSFARTFELDISRVAASTNR
jgi:hypothetical protein